MFFGFPSELKLSRVVLLVGFFACFAFTQDANLMALYQQAKSAEASGDYKSATANYEKIIRLRPDMAEAYANLGNLYYLQGETQKAETTFRKAMAIKPSLPGPHFFLGVFSFKKRAYHDALTFLEEAERLDPVNNLVQAYLGYTQFALHNYSQAAAHLEKAATSDAKDSDVFYHLSKAYGNLAKEDFGNLEKSFAGSLYAMLARAHFYETQQNWDQALQNYQRVAAIQPDYPYIQEKIQEIGARKSGRSVKTTGAIDPSVDGALALFYNPPANHKVLEILEEYLQREHQLRAGEGQSAAKLYELAESDQALSYLAGQWVFEIDPESFRAHEMKGQYYEASDDDEKAIAEYRKALQINPQLPNVHFVIGNLYWKRERLDEALPELKQELQTDPNHPQALYEMGDIFLAREQLADAEASFLKALKMEPDMKEANLALARIYTDRHQIGKAAAQLSRAAQIDPQDPTPHYRLSKLYQESGKTEAAQSELAIFAKLKRNRAPDNGK